MWQIRREHSAIRGQQLEVIPISQRPCQWQREWGCKGLEHVYPAGPCRRASNLQHPWRRLCIEMTGVYAVAVGVVFLLLSDTGLRQRRELIHDFHVLLCYA